MRFSRSDGSVKRRVRQRQLELAPRLAIPLDDIPDTPRWCETTLLARRSPMLAHTQPP
jgi:pyocin large subunit-like protein